MTRIVAAGDWLRRAQDATGDGGVAWAYGLHRGWGPSYPETTGYIIPTFLDLAAVTGDEDFADRARRCLDFLLPLQLPGGAFPAGTLEEPERRPSIFNTGQIICGLNAWYRRTGDAEIGEVARRAGVMADRATRRRRRVASPRLPRLPGHLHRPLELLGGRTRGAPGRSGPQGRRRPASRLGARPAGSRPPDGSSGPDSARRITPPGGR